jgi:hypothetical protein
MLAIVLSGCAASSRKPAGNTAAPAPPQTQSSASSPAPQPSAPPSPPVQEPTVAAPHETLTPHETPQSNQAKGAASTEDAPGQRKIPAAPPTNASKGATSDTRKAKPPPTAAVKSPAPDKPSTPALDLSTLEQRLKDTRAIGVFTKLSLKNQVDDLLAEFRAFHQSPTKTPPAELRHQYDLLMLKVLSLLQKGDPQLASVIASSREAIWGILVDPEKFSKI